MARKHYHVLGGLHGYMPDFNYFASSRKQAEQLAVEEIRNLREDGAKAWGSSRDGYYEVSSTSGIEYVEITECYESDCEKYKEDY